MRQRRGRWFSPLPIGFTDSAVLLFWFSHHQSVKIARSLRQQVAGL